MGNFGEVGLGRVGPGGRLHGSFCVSFGRLAPFLRALSATPYLVLLLGCRLSAFEVIDGAQWCDKVRSFFSSRCAVVTPVNQRDSATLLIQEYVRVFPKLTTQRIRPPRLGPLARTPESSKAARITG